MYMDMLVLEDCPYERLEDHHKSLMMRDLLKILAKDTDKTNEGMIKQMRVMMGLFKLSMHTRADNYLYQRYRIMEEYLILYEDWVSYDNSIKEFLDIKPVLVCLLN